MVDSPWLRDSFYPVPAGYMSVNDSIVPCPPYSVACEAGKAAAFIDLPAGYSAETLEQIRWTTGVIDVPVLVSHRQASELAVIGKQLLDLAGKGRPNLGESSRQSIEYLIRTVEGP